MIKGKIECSGESIGNYISITHIHTGRQIIRVPWGDGDSKWAAEIVDRWNEYEGLKHDELKAKTVDTLREQNTRWYNSAQNRLERLTEYANEIEALKKYAEDLDTWHYKRSYTKDQKTHYENKPKCPTQ